ncbi:WD40-repeat-containing domain protein [Papiliotrema laurentii]|uniref:WD40-repeat-containing domain protein n=1 Tax=Papiliotrema laurentii TaxID=5418 RepID=A0AAD9FKZ5_PAPLA|nr:WD40-repeat-containing domain protein [Papiliotrema laurentii]
MFRSAINSITPAMAKDIELVSPPPDSVSKIAFSPTQDILAVASWDNNVRLYEVNSQGQSQAKAMYAHQAPVLDLDWSTSGQHLFSAGCDNAVQMYDISTGQNQQVAQHDAPIKCVRYLDMNGGMIATASWDKTLKYWDLRSPQPVGTVQLAGKALSMDTEGKLLVVAGGNRQIHLLNLDQPMSIWKTIESPLKWQTRVVSCFPTMPGQKPDEQAYAIGSVEGRVAIQFPFVDEIKAPKNNYSFKCHRYDIPVGSMSGTPATSGSQNVFAVNTIDFHKVHGTFCTGGSDGSLTVWDGFGRTKVKPFSLKDLNNGDSDAKPPQFGVPIVSTSFNRTQEILAYAFSYDWSKGHSGVPPAGQNTTRIMLHPVKPEEVQKKNKTR